MLGWSFNEVLLNRNINKQRRLLCLFLAFSFIFVSHVVTFATSHEKANVVVGPNSTDANQMYVDGKNFALDALQNVMSNHDFLLAMVYVSDYRKGDKSAMKSLTDLVATYNIENANQIINYILQDSTVKLLGSYAINHASNTLSYVQMNGLTTASTGNLDMTANAIWVNMQSFLPLEFLNSITTIHLELNKDKNTLITIHESSEDASTWEMNVDISLLDVDKKEELYKNLVYATVFYYCLRTDQIEFISPKKDNYMYQTKYYKNDSYINKFYKKFWKDRRQEVNTSQYGLYKNEFLDEKASRTVYDDMAVSFYNYVTKGIMRRYLGFRADKNNFFDDIPIFKELAKIFRIKLGVKIS